MKVPWLAELLTDQLASNCLAIVNYERPASLTWKNQLRDRSHDPRIDQSRHHDQHEREENSGTKLFPYHDIFLLLDRVNQDENDIDELDADEGDNEPADAVDDEIAAEDYSRRRRTVFHSSQRERNQSDDNERVEDHAG